MSTLASSLVTLLNQACDGLLRLDPAVHEQLDKLQGKVICIRLTAPEITLFASPDANGLNLSANHDGAVDVEISGSFFAFVNMLKPSGNPTASAGGVQFSGDVELAQQAQRILGRLDLDWQEALSKVVGDGVTRGVAQFGEQARAWFNQSKAYTMENTATVLQDDIRLLANRLEFAEFSNQVDSLRADCDRLNQRLATLRQQIKP